MAVNTGVIHEEDYSLYKFEHIYLIRKYFINFINVKVDHFFKIGAVTYPSTKSVIPTPNLSDIDAIAVIGLAEFLV